METSLYELTIRLSSGSPIKEYRHPSEKNTFIEGRKGSEYTIHFRNKGSTSLLAVFSVDGLSVMDGKAAGPQSQGYVVPAYGSISVPGWRLDSSKVAAFQFQPSGDGDKTYAEKLKGAGFDVDTQNQGVIGVMVWLEQPKVYHTYTQYVYKPNNYHWPQHVPVSYNYNSSETLIGASLNAVGSASFGSTLSAKADTTRSYEAAATLDWYEPSQVGTGFGRDVKFETVNTTFTRSSVEPVSISVIHYDTLAGLRRRGVLVDEPRGVRSAFPNYDGPTSGCFDPR